MYSYVHVLVVDPYKSLILGAHAKRHFFHHIGIDSKDIMNLKYSFLLLEEMYQSNVFQSFGHSP